MTDKVLNISVVIPTRNRPDDLARTLNALAKQTYPLREVILIDSSDTPLQESFVKPLLQSIPFKILYSVPSVCIQRNLGIAESTSDHVFLCDDDIEVSENYLSILSQEILAEESCQAVSGMVLEKDSNGKWISQRPQKNKWSLLFAYVFHLSVWGRIDHIESNWWTDWLKRKYKKKGNTYSKAGWPINTDFTSERVRTSIHGLGASLCRRQALVESPYNEVLDPFGIGDNYGVSLGFKNQPGILVLKRTNVKHHKSGENRITKLTAYYRRVLALDLFLTEKSQFNRTSRIHLLWSLLGHAILFLAKFRLRFLSTVLKLIVLIATRSNPYIRASKKGFKTIEPQPFQFR